MSQRSLSPTTADVSSVWISFFLCIAIALIVLLTANHAANQFAHWFLVPVLLCGILVGIDFVDWLRDRLSLFDPVGILGAFGFYFFFLAPLLHVQWDRWLEVWYIPPADWRPWLGGMAILNLLGLIVYRITRRWIKPKNQIEQSVWRIDRVRFYWLLGLGMAIAALLQIRVYQQFGGIAGYIETVVEFQGLGDSDANPFKGMGIVFLISESFPILALFGFTIYAQQRPRLRTSWVLLIVLAIFVLLQLFFGGLRGSRSNMIWALFWASGIIHFWIRPMTKKMIAIALVLIVLFMYLYGFFKTNGIEGVEAALQGQTARAQIEQTSGRNLQGLFLGDFGRTDIQAFVLYRLMRSDTDYSYAWGGTYLSAAATLIPSKLMSDRPVQTKNRQGTELEFGRGAFVPEQWQSSKLYALAGEAMLNFGAIAVPFVFAPFGLLVGWIRRCSLTWNYPDSRLLLLPALVNFCLVVLISDMDNNIFFLMKNCAFPMFILLLSSRKISRENYHDSTVKPT